MLVLFVQDSEKKGKGKEEGEKKGEKHEGDEEMEHDGEEDEEEEAEVCEQHPYFSETSLRTLLRCNIFGQVADVKNKS